MQMYESFERGEPVFIYVARHGIDKQKQSLIAGVRLAQGDSEYTASSIYVFKRTG